MIKNDVVYIVLRCVPHAFEEILGVCATRELAGTFVQAIKGDYCDTDEFEIQKWSVKR